MEADVSQELLDCLVWPQNIVALAFSFHPGSRREMRSSLCRDLAGAAAIPESLAPVGVTKKVINSY